MNTHHEEANREKVLRLMAEKYPTKEIVYEKIVYLRSQLMLPKGTEHFMSDLHGAYDSFFHILNNCSGVIKEKVDYCFGERMTEEDKAEFCTLIYYPREKVEQLAAEGKNTAIWYQQNLANLLELTKLMSWKFPASKVYSYIPKRYESVIVELMNTRPEQDEAQLFYYKQLIETIVEIGVGTDYIEAFSVLIKRLAVERIHIVGDFFDRGDRPDGILDLLMEHPSVDIQWGNHDVLWMGAALGSEVCIAGVIRNSLRYRNTDVLERGYGISLRPLSTFASRIYPDENPIKAAERAITMMMFKLEGALIRRNPDFRMEDRLLLDKIDFRSSYVTLGNGRRVELESAYFPTIDDGTDCYELTEEERFSAMWTISISAAACIRAITVTCSSTPVSSSTKRASFAPSHIKEKNIAGVHGWISARKRRAKRGTRTRRKGSTSCISCGAACSRRRRGARSRPLNARSLPMRAHGRSRPIHISA